MLRIKGLSKTFYPGTPEENIVFQNFSLDIEDHTCTAILGPNGCGKSTLFQMISGSLVQDDGSIELDDFLLTDLPEEKRAKYIGKVSQDPSMGVSPSLSILENMSIAMKKGEPFSFKKLLKKQDLNFIVAKLKELNLGLEDKLNTEVKFLSGGQRQSLSLLMATLRTPRILLLDEHTAALDPKTSRLIMEKTKDFIQRDGLTTLMITHNLKNAIDYGDRIIMLNEGQIALDVDANSIREDELLKLYNEQVEQSLRSEFLQAV
ncbi:MAG: ATP-binding cassette domain-containing protein [Tissierellia bacterium]|nr:ATP-binding cassette domain-containing protein [Tissierellia bacterium]